MCVWWRFLFYWGLTRGDLGIGLMILILVLTGSVQYCKGLIEGRKRRSEEESRLAFLTFLYVHACSGLQGGEWRGVKMS